MMEIAMVTVITILAMVIVVVKVVMDMLMLKTMMMQNGSKILVWQKHHRGWFAFVCPTLVLAIRLVLPSEGLLPQKPGVRRCRHQVVPDLTGEVHHHKGQKRKVAR